jgi:hypothetical protein
MKVFCAALIVVVAASSCAWAQVRGIPGQAMAHATANVEELARQQRDNPPGPPAAGQVFPFLSGSRKTSARTLARGRRDIPAPQPAREPAIATSSMSLPAAAVNSPAPTAIFEALADNNTKIPPGTMGAAGPNHLMVTLNSEVRIQNRTGTELSKVTLESFWSSVTTLSSDGVFNPQILFDRFTQRWFFSAASARGETGSSILIGASQNSNPTGTWNLYRLDADSQNLNWVESPTMGFNKDWVVVSLNAYAIADSSFVGADLYVFRKSNLMAGTGAIFSYFPAFGFSQVPAITHDNFTGTMYLVEDFDSDVGGGVGQLGVSTITGAVGAESYNDLVVLPPIESTWATSPPSLADFAPQQGTATKIQNGDSRICSVVYRNGFLWTAQSVFLPTNSPTRTAVQWAQIQLNGVLRQWGRIDDPTGQVFYAYPSLAVNSLDDVLIGFSTFSGTQFAAAGYAMRAASDALNTMRVPMVLKAGEAAYVKKFGGSKNSWGDYSATMVDPLNDFDFWTIQEYASSPLFANPNPGKWGTWWGKFSNLTPPRARPTRQLTGD